MATVSQAQRLVRVSTPLGDDVLVPTSFSGQEHISRLFAFQLEAVSLEDSLSADELVGKRVTISIERVDEEPRFFDGFVSRFSNLGKSHNQTRYQAEVVPWLWFLTRTADCRIFQHLSVPDIIQQVFKDLGFSDFEFQLKGGFPPLEYCVQYRESAFNFVSRLMEREGIYYYFKHEDGGHTLVMANHKGAYSACPEQEVEFVRVGSGEAHANRIDRWQHDYEFRPGKWAQSDYNFETPSNDLLTGADSVVSLPNNAKFEIFDFPGEYPDTDEGQKYTDLRMEEDETPHNLATGTSTCKSFSPGHWFELIGHEIGAENGQYVITSVQHWATNASDADTGPGGREEYTNSFTCIPKSVVYRPPRITPRPMVRGPQVAVVTGPAGEEIYVDAFGRVKVQFPWDRRGKKDENSSCWIRVSQVHAGKGFGGIDIPRIGEEVIVVFYEGNPERPLITGRVYHAENMPPYGLPGGMNISGLKSNSTKGGGGYNEFILDDTKGNELIRVHGQYDMDTTIEHDLREHVLNDRSRDVTHDETILIGNDRSKTVENDETTQVDGNRTETVGKDETITIHGNRTETVDKNETITIDGARTEKVAKDETITINGSRKETVAKNETITINGGRTETVAKDERISINGGRTEQVAKDEGVTIGGGRTHSVGKSDTLSVAKMLTVTAGDQISLTTGKASIVMKKDGTITISGKDITINGTGQITEKAAKDIVLKGKKILQN